MSIKVKNRVAIIIVNYNGLQDTIECVKSVSATENVNYKIIIIDNASDNNEGKQLCELFPDAKVIINDKNIGFAGGNNIGIDYAMKNDYDYVLLLNNDTVIDNKMIYNLLEYANSITITVPKMYYYYDKTKIWYGGGIINKITGNAKHLKFNQMDDGKGNIKHCNFATGCCMLIHRDIIRQIGKLSEDYFMYCEDTEYSLRALINNKSVMYVPEAKLWHKVGASTGQEKSELAIYYNTRNKLLYLQKYHNYFSKLSYPYTIITRYIRIFQYMLSGNLKWKCIIKGIKDYKNGSVGKTEKYY